MNIFGIEIQFKGKGNPNGNGTFQRRDLCDQIHKSVDEKLSCIPQIKTKVIRIETKLNLLLSKNGIEHDEKDDGE